MRSFIFLVSIFVSASLMAKNAKTLPEKKVKTKTIEAGAETTTGSEEKGIPGNTGTMKFNTDVELEGKEKREPIMFKMDDKRSGTESTQNSEQLSPEESQFKAYPGYPKHQLVLGVEPSQVNSKWTFNSADFNYKSNSSSAMGFSYRYISTPMVSFSVDYSKYDVAIKASTVNVGSLVNITESDTTVDTYGIKANFCKIMQGSFFQQLCGGIDLGVESYPILDFTSGSTLAMDKVQDVIVGINVGYNHPLTDGIILKTKLGYNLGTGAGSSGSLSTKSNNSLYVKGDFEWMFREHHGATVGVEYKSRSAEIEGVRAGVDESWKSTITTTAAKAGYIYSF